MLTLSPGAVDLIRELRAHPAVPDDADMRIAAEERDGTSSLTIAFVEDAVAEDAIIEAPDVRLFVAPEVADMLDDKVLDALPDEAGSATFVITDKTA